MKIEKALVRCVDWPPIIAFLPIHDGGYRVRTLETLQPLLAHLREVQHLNSAAALLSWDQETYMPSGGGQARADQLATLQGLAHDKLVSPEVEALLSQWVDPATGQAGDQPGDAWDESSRSLLREAWRDFSRAKKLPSDFVKRLGRECSLAQQVWAEARAQNAFRRFLPNLRTIVALKLEETQYLGYRDSPYDALLDHYEPGATVATLTPLFATVKARLVPLLNRVMASRVTVDDALLFQAYDPTRQVEFGKLVLTAMGYDFDRGRLDLSAHPFTTSFHPTDVRVTTRVYEKEFSSCLFSCIHEGGHGLYDQGLDQERYGTPLGEALSLGIHESQSRLWENCVGRSRPFWRCFYPLLQQLFPDQLQAVELDRFYAAINRVKPSLIRVEADELTYNLHIMLRFEIERDVIEGRIAVEDLPAVWNEKMRDYLGLIPPTDAEGVLQDVHWSFGAFGYFPTYTLGNLYAIQLYEQARRDIQGLEEEIAAGRLTVLKQWLNQKVHRWGRTFTADHLIRRVTGSPLNPDPFLSYLEEKYGRLYGLPATPQPQLR
ncbi:MAG: carboxypeptidase M32 [Nitrospirota bacterium]|nr:carboxypeptidase M32 [Nitrospirota bacterium]MDE3242813.1 carboxypeptidase M32 [Nitrospirota bacterium]